MDVQKAARAGRSVRDVMTGNPTTVSRSTPVEQIVRLLNSHRVGAVPVVDLDGRPVGIVSETDLGPRSRRELIGSVGLVAADLMSCPVHTVSASAGLGEAARLLRAKGVKRLPVVDDGGFLVGIVSRGDMLGAFLRPDGDLVRDVREDVMVRTLWMDPELVSVTALDGVITLKGIVGRRSDIPILTRLIGGVDGVVGISSSLTYRFDDTRGMDAPTLGYPRSPR